jgi:hypothetical protein
MMKQHGVAASSSAQRLVEVAEEILWYREYAQISNSHSY